MDFDGVARQVEEMIAAGERAGTEAVQKVAFTLNISPGLAGHLLAPEVGIGYPEGI